MAASLRSTHPVAKAALPNRVGRLGHRLSESIRRWKWPPTSGLNQEGTSPKTPGAGRPRNATRLSRQSSTTHCREIQGGAGLPLARGPDQSAEWTRLVTDECRPCRCDATTFAELWRRLLLIAWWNPTGQYRAAPLFRFHVGPLAKPCNRYPMPRSDSRR